MEQNLLKFSSLQPFPQLRCVVSTRQGGGSAPPYESCNLGFSVGDDPTVVQANRQSLFASAEVHGEQVVSCQQVHRDRIARVGAPEAGRGALDLKSGIPECDGLLTTESDVYLLVQSADCALVALFAPPSLGVAVVHSGWRGTALGIARLAVEMLSAATRQPSTSMRAVLAPSIDACCYEVGPEVLTALRAPSDAVTAIDSSGRARISLRRVIVEQLVSAGIVPAAIETHPDCTFCQPKRYFSYRYNGARTGRFGLLAGIRGQATRS